VPPAVSIITPYYNTGAIFLETAQSVLQQSLQQWEWLIINDGSDDEHALSVLNDYRGSDPRIRVIDLAENQGLPAARNAGLRRARSDLLFFLDSDDLIEPTALEKMAWCLESYPEFAFCKGRTVGFGAQQYWSSVGFESTGRFLDRNPVTISAMVKRKLALSVGGFDEALRSGLEDWDFWLRCAAEGSWGTTIPEYFDWFRRRHDHSARWADWTESGLQMMRKELSQRYPVLFAEGLPEVRRAVVQPYGNISDSMPFTNPLVKERKRLLLVVPWMAMGGADKFNIDMVTQLKKRGFEVTIAAILSENYDWYAEFASLTPDIFILPNFIRMNDYPRFLSYLIRSRQIGTVMISNSELGYKILPYLCSRNPDVAFVDYSHMEEEHWKGGGFPRYSVRYQEMLDLSIVTSDHLKQWMVDKGADPEKVEVCYVSVDTNSFSPDQSVRQDVREEMGIPTDMPLILYAGRICEQKQPRVFAETMRVLKSRGLDFLCLVAGDGEDRQWLSAYLRRHRLRNRVWVMGAVSNQRVREVLAASDIFFLPSKMEGIAITIYESMAMGVVPVGADVGGQRELVTPESGVLIERASEELEVAEYAEVLEKLIRSPELRDSMGKAARERVCLWFDIEQMGDRMKELLTVSHKNLQSSEKVMVPPGLAEEHVVQAVEHEMLSRSTLGLEKYRAIESLRRQVQSFWEEQRASLWRFLGPIERFARRLGLVRRAVGAVRKVKDAMWIVGHRWKVRLLNLEEFE
jgi:glycosyltransferase involved in cell wall biosynthesis